MRLNIFKLIRFFWDFFTEKPIPTPPGVEEWVRVRLDALRFKNKESFLDGFYPRSRSALSGDGPMKDLMEREFSKPALENWTLKVTSVDPREALLLDDLLEYPVRPTHLVCATQKKAHESRSQVWYLIQESGKWYAVLPVPKEKYTAQMAQGHKELIEAEDRIQKIYFSADPDSSADSKPTASGRCQKSSGFFSAQ